MIPLVRGGTEEPFGNVCWREFVWVSLYEPVKDPWIVPKSILGSDDNSPGVWERPVAFHDDLGCTTLQSPPSSISSGPTNQVNSSSENKLKVDCTTLSGLFISASIGISIDERLPIFCFLNLGLSLLFTLVFVSDC
jgi:hypothetical protein